MWIIWPLLYSPPVEMCVVCHKMIVMTLMMTWVCASVQSWRGAYDLHGRTLHMCIYECVYIYIRVAYTLTYESRIHLRMSRMAELLPSALSLSLSCSCSSILCSSPILSPSSLLSTFDQYYYKLSWPKLLIYFFLCAPLTLRPQEVM